MEMSNLFNAIKNVILQSASCSIKNQVLRVGDSGTLLMRIYFNYEVYKYQMLLLYLTRLSR